MAKLLVIDVVSLTREHLEGGTSALKALAREGFAADLNPVLPAVTCPVQASMLTGRLPRDHGIVGNGWYFRDLAQVWLWRQANQLIQAPKVWDVVRKQRGTLAVAKLFWWYNMYSTATWSVTPRPHYTSDGRKYPGIYTEPPELEKELEGELGAFPLFNFWGPEAGIASTRWIVECSLHVLSRLEPDLTVVYLPHLDYDLQRFGPQSEEAGRAVRDLDREVGRLIGWARDRGYEVLLLSEYAMSEVRGAVMVNCVLREHGFLRARESLGRELLDCGASRAFAVTDHQAAHVYVKRSSDVPAVRELLAGTEGVEEVLDAEGKRVHGLDHERSGELVAFTRSDRWFAYPWWLSDDRAPDFARTVDIHQKPGYDPLELFYDPRLTAPRLRAVLKLLWRRLGFRTLFDLIGFDTSLVRGSHGRVIAGNDHVPVVVGSDGRYGRDSFRATDIFTLIRQMLGDREA